MTLLTGRPAATAEPRPAAGSDRPPVIGYVITAVAFVGLVVCASLELTTTALVITVAGLLGLAIADLRSLLILSFPIYGLLGSLFSVALIENGAYVTEQFRYGTNLGATSWLGMYTLAFLTVAHVATTRLLTRRAAAGAAATAPPAFRKAVVAIAVAVGLFYALAFAKYGTGLSYADLRFGWNRALSPAFQKGHSISATYLIPASFGMTAYYATQARRLEAWYGVLVVPVVCVFLTGEKFGGFVLSATVAAAGVGIAAFARRERINANPRVVVLAGVAVALLAASLVRGFQRMGFTDVWTAVERRMVLQGHVWFGIYDRFGGSPGVSLSDLVRPNSLDQPAGLDRLSYLVSDPSFVHDRIEHGVTFTMGGPPSLLAAFGDLGGLVGYGLLGLALAWAASMALRYLRRGRPLSAIAGLGFFVVVGTATQMGRWDSVYGQAGLACLALFLCDGVVRSSRPRRAAVADDAR